MPYVDFLCRIPVIRPIFKLLDCTLIMLSKKSCTSRKSYKKVSAQVAKVYTVGVALENIKDSEIDNKTREDVYNKEATTLLNMTFSEMLFLDKAIYEQVFKVIQMKPSEYSKNKGEIKKVIDSLREDLNLQRLNVMNQLSTLPVDITALSTSIKERFYKEK